MKQLIIYLTIISILITSCGNNNQQPLRSEKSSVNVSVKEAEPSISDGLPLKLVGQLVAESKSPENLEKELNKPNGINNLDLNKDGKVDYIRVTEQNDGDNRKYILSTKDDTDNEIEVATVTLTPNQKLEQVDMTISGNERVYPPSEHHHHHYHSSIGFTDFLLVAWLLTPRPVYYTSPYHPPVYYQPAPVVSYREHSSRTTTITKRSKITYKRVEPTTTSKLTSNDISKTKNTTFSQTKADDNKYKSIDKSNSLNSSGFTSKSKPITETKKENTNFSSVDKKPLGTNSFSSSTKDNSTKTSSSNSSYSSSPSKTSNYSSSSYSTNNKNNNNSNSSRSSGFSSSRSSSNSSKGSSWSSGGSKSSSYSSNNKNNNNSSSSRSSGFSNSRSSSSSSRGSSWSSGGSRSSSYSSSRSSRR